MVIVHFEIMVRLIIEKVFCVSRLQSVDT